MYYLEAFLEHFRGIALGYAEAVEFRRLIAAPDAEQKASTAQRVDHRGIFRHPQRMLKRQDDDGGADFHICRALRHGRCEQQGIAQHAVYRKMMFGQPDGIETERFTVLDLLHDFAEQFVLRYVAKIAK